MSKRASIFFILSGLVLLYGLIDSFLLSATSPRQAMATEVYKVENVKAALAVIADRVRLDQLRPEELALLEVIEPVWPRDPFADAIRLAMSRSTNPVAGRDQANAEHVPEALVYEGYLTIGGRMSAFISGAAYVAGDRLPDGRTIVREIAREAVMLEDATTGEVRLLGMEKPPDTMVIF